MGAPHLGQYLIPLGRNGCTSPWAIPDPLRCRMGAPHLGQYLIPLGSNGCTSPWAIPDPLRCRMGAPHLGQYGCTSLWAITDPLRANGCTSLWAITDPLRAHGCASLWAIPDPLRANGCTSLWAITDPVPPPRPQVLAILGLWALRKGDIPTHRLMMVRYYGALSGAYISLRVMVLFIGTFPYSISFALHTCHFIGLACAEVTVRRYKLFEKASKQD